MIEMVRIPSETHNISNIDDFVGLRYAYGNQNGYVIDKGNECSYTINGSIFKINSGRLVLQGVECDIDADGVELTIDNISTKRYYVVYLQINLSLNTTKILTAYDTSTYPIIDNGDDLTLNTTGVANMEMYRFDATGGVISNVEKTMSKIEYTGTALSDYDISKGTVEERLTNLGFKQGSVDLFNAALPDDADSNYLIRQGNYVICKIHILNFDIRSDFIIGQIPNGFLPKEDFYIRVPFNKQEVYPSPNKQVGYFNIKVNTQGNIIIETATYIDAVYAQSGPLWTISSYENKEISNWSGVTNIIAYFGYEATPIQNN